MHVGLHTQGRRVGRKRVARLLRGIGPVARCRRLRRRDIDSRHDVAVAPNLLQRDSRAAALDRVWLTKHLAPAASAAKAKRA